ncbi:MAG: pyruvoyl-dependent arginine decarboxylase [Candidatus Woesearchaeota archaeon]
MNGKLVVEVKSKEKQKEVILSQNILIGNRIPKDYFVTTGHGESDITIHAGSYHLALKAAGIEMCNIMTYSSIMPAIATEIERPQMTHGEVMESIMAVAHSTKGKPATAGIIYGWLYDRKTGEKYGGLVCEHNGNFSKKEVEKLLHLSLNELYTNGFDDKYELKNIRMTTESFTPKKKYGTALVAVCFKNYLVPIVS